MRVNIVRFIFRVNVPVESVAEQDIPDDIEMQIGLDLQDFEELVNEQIADLEMKGYKVVDVQFDRYKDKGTAYIKYRSPILWFF